MFSTSTWINEPAKQIGLGPTMFLMTNKVMALVFLVLFIINLPLIAIYSNAIKVDDTGGCKYSDSSFPADKSMVVWPGYERTDYAQLTKYLKYIRGFKRPTEVEKSPSLWGIIWLRMITT